MCLPDFLQFGSMHPEEGFGVRRMIRNTFVSPCEGAHLRQLSGSLLRRRLFGLGWSEVA